MIITKQMKAFVAMQETRERRKDRWGVRQIDAFVQPVATRDIPYRLPKKTVRMQRFRRFGGDAMRSIHSAMKKSLKKFDALIASIKD